MECFINLFALCVFDPSNLYVTAELLAPLNRTHTQYEGRWCATEWCTGPVGEVRVGVHVDVTRTFALTYGLRHSSMINTTRDQGENAAFVQLTFRPFR